MISKINSYTVNVLILLISLTIGCKKSKLDSPWKVPTVISQDASNITTNSAYVAGTISSNGGRKVTVSGVCWGLNPNPTIENSKTADGVDSGYFNSKITGLEIGTKYYVRAYATNSVGTGYGLNVSFTTKGLPTLTTLSISNILQNSANGGGDVVSSDAPVIERGVCWSTDPSPRISDNKSSDGSGVGSFNSNIVGLNGGTTYYVRAYATSSIGTGYGNSISFTTPGSNLPILTTNTVTNVSYTAASCGGDISSFGAGPVIERGVCWSLNPNPTIIQNPYTSDGNGIGMFSSLLTGLIPNTTYYVRAFAENGSGIAYGNNVSFNTTYAVLPTITSTSISNVNYANAVIAGNVTNEGGAAVTARGICWSLSPNPTIGDNITLEGNGLGNFASNVSGLYMGANYYARAYATNIVGTSYANQVSFKTQVVSLGDNFQGGIVFYILQPGDPGYSSNAQHGLIASTSDQASSIRWYNGSNSTSGATSTAIGSGYSNTQKIINVQGAVKTSYASGLAQAYNGGGFSDWYLPSKDELNKLYLGKNYVGVFASGFYWSSSEYSNSSSWGQNFRDGSQNIASKSDFIYIRAIRSF